MPVTVGTNSYLTVQDFKDNADMFGLPYDSYTDEQIEQALSRSALMYIDSKYKFKGEQLDEAQKMDLPTSEVVIVDIVYGATQAAYQALIGKLFVSESSQSANGLVTSESKQLSSLSKSVEYQEGTARTSFYDTGLIDNLMQPYITGYSSAGGNMGKLRKC